MAEERHLKELQRATQEEIEEQNRREVAKRMHDEEMRLAEAKESKKNKIKRLPLNVIWRNVKSMMSICEQQNVFLKKKNNVYVLD